MYSKIESWYAETTKYNSLKWLDQEAIIVMNDVATQLLNKETWDDNDINIGYKVLLISNIIYNNTEINPPIEDGIYDLLVVKYNKLVETGAPVGAPPIEFERITNENYTPDSKDDISSPKRILFRTPKDNFIYDNYLSHNHSLSMWYGDGEDFQKTSVLNKEIKMDTEHMFPELVGTLDKCKFVLNADAYANHLDLEKDPTITTFEKDFMNKCWANGIIFDELIAELKYDGVSVELMVDSDTIIGASSRGDTKNDVTRDLTPIFGGLKFPNAVGKVQPGTVFGLKTECIITKDNLALLSRETGKTYKNPRVAVIGILGSLNARELVRYLTLVPIRTSGLNIPSRETEIEFLNKFYTFGIDLHYMVLNGNYETLLYQVREFVRDSESVRPIMNFMYDGVVVSITDPKLKEKLGRKNSVDKWSIAIKFNTMIKETMFLGYSYSVGQNGIVVPKAHFAPVEFLGTIHDNTTAHSYNRFKQLGLKYGDMVSIELRNDVICYINKPENAYNMANPNPLIEFPKICPSCGTPLVFTDKSAVCPNIHCPERNLSRISNMVKKLGIKDFSDNYLKRLGISSLKQLLEYDINVAKSILGDKLGENLIDRINEFKNTIYPDYRIIGSIGFSSVAVEKWKLILAEVNLERFVDLGDKELHDILITIKGIGPGAVDTICKERNGLMDDIKTIIEMPNVERTFGKFSNSPKVRFTGVRDEELCNLFNSYGYDANGDKSVTKDTAILIVPYIGFTSSKTKKIGPNCIVLDPSQARNYIYNLNA